ncbi:MAG: TlpA disulfide reductase family protein, partial [Planctomycetota bacterium]
EFFPVDALLDRALDDGEITTQERDLTVAVLQGIATSYGDAKYPLSAKTWGEFANLGVASLSKLVLSGERAPELVGQDLTGAEVRLTALRGKAVLLCFWGDWCLPCRSHYARQRQLVSHLAGKPFAMLGVNSDPARAVLEIVSVKEDMRWPNVWDGAEGTGGKIATRWSVRAWPTWYVLDAQGIVRAHWRGVPAQSEIDAVLETWIPKAR